MLQIEMFEDMLAKYPIKGVIREGERPIKVKTTMNVTVRVSIRIYPMGVFNPPGTAAKIQV
jgi:hypothetical protein